MHFKTISVFLVFLNIHSSFCKSTNLPERCERVKNLGDFSVKGNTAVQCNALGENDLSKTVDALAGKELNTLILSNSQLKNLPEKAFLNANFKTLIFDSFDIDILIPPYMDGLEKCISNVDPFCAEGSNMKQIPTNEDYTNSVFSGLVDNIRTLEIRNSKSVYGWMFAKIGPFLKLENLIIESSNFCTLDKSLMRLSKKGLKYLSLRNSNLQYLEDHSLHRTDKLEFLNLSQNNISELKQSYFAETPNAWSNLWYLDLSDNKLTSIDSEIFDKFKSLKEFHLENNMIKYLEPSIFKQIWNSLQELWISGNKFTCEELCWLISSKGGPSFWSSAQCETNGQNKTLYKFKMEDSCIILQKPLKKKE